MEYQVKILVDIVSEPVTLTEQKAWSQIDDSYSLEDSIISSMITAGRELLEKQLNIFFGVKTVETQFSQPCFRLPYGPTGDILSIYNQGDDPYADTDYELQGLTFKTLVMSSVDGVTWFYPMGSSIPYPWGWPMFWCNTYNVIYTTGYTSLPQALKNALMTQVDYMIKGRGAPQFQPLSPIAMQMAKTYSQNLDLPL